MRAQVSAAYLFTVDLIGLGFGPALVPLISDYVLRDPMQLRWGPLIVVLVAGSTAVPLWFTRPRYRAQIAATAQWQ